MNKKNILVYSITSYAWSYTLWLIAIIFAFTKDFNLILNEATPEALYSGRFVGNIAFMSVLALFATWGPFIGSLVVSKIDPTFSNEFRTRLKIVKKPKYYLIVILVFVSIGLVPSLPLLLLNGRTNITISTGLLYFITFFIVQLFSSGIEELGWRGFLMPEFLKKYDSWSACFYTGIIWSFWHLPIVLYIFYIQGMPLFAMIPSYFGFTVGMVAMSVVHFYFYHKTKSVLFSVYVHSVSNAVPLIAGLLIVNSHQVAIASQLLIWVVVFIIMKRNKELFQKNNITAK